MSSTSLQLCMLTTEPLLEVQFGITSVLKNTAATNGRGFAVFRRSTALRTLSPSPPVPSLPSPSTPGTDTQHFKEERL